MEPILDPEEQDLERGLLSAGRDVHMSKRLQAQTLTALGVGAVSLTAAATAQAGTVVWFKTKIGILLLSVGGTMGALGATYWIADSMGGSDGAADSSASQAPPASAQTSPSPQVETPVTQEQEPAAKVSVPAADPALGAEPALAGEGAKSLTQQAENNGQQRATSKPGTTTGAKSQSSLTDELDHIRRATSALGRGQPQVAIQILSDYQKRFPHPQLGLEVEVLRIEALAKSGNQTEAQNRGNRFIARYPNSALVARVKRVLR